MASADEGLTGMLKETSEAAIAEAEPYPPAIQAWVAVFLLLILSLVSVLDKNIIAIQTTVRNTGKTGAEMEALTAAAGAALAVYDMLKGQSHDVVIERIELVEKRGGRSGVIRRRVSRPR